MARIEGMALALVAPFDKDVELIDSGRVTLTEFGVPTKAILLYMESNTEANKKALEQDIKNKLLSIGNSLESLKGRAVPENLAERTQEEYMVRRK